MKRLFLVLALAPLASCGSDPAPITPNDFFQQRADIECAALSTACLMPEATCTAGRLAQHATEYQTAVAAFRTFVPANAEACLAKVRAVYGKISAGAVALAGSEYLGMLAVCANVYRGASAEYQPCQSDLDCNDGLICDPKGDGVGHCGTPKLVGPGAGCANIGEYCPTGAYCLNNGNSSTGDVWLCTAKVTAQGACSSTSPCLETLRCSAGLCVARLDIGEACASDGDCNSNFCEPYALRCANDIRFAPGSPACIAVGGS